MRIYGDEIGVKKGPKMIGFQGPSTINTIVVALKPYYLGPWTLRGGYHVL